MLKQCLCLDNRYNIINSTNLANDIVKLTINNKHRMITYDVKDLYVNIPTDETLKITENQLLKNNYKHKTKQIITILKTILAQNYFTFHDTIYHPNKDVAMGSPISGTMAEIFLQYIENRHLKHLLDSKNIIFYTRYVDDIFIIYDTTRTTADSIHNYINNIHNCLQLNPTYENNTQIFWICVLLGKQINWKLTSTQNPLPMASPSTTSPVTL